MLTRAEKERRFLLIREKRIREARGDFWEFCRVESPDFFTNDKWHLKIYCYALQALYERNLTKDFFNEICQEYAPTWFMDVFEFDNLQPNYTYTKLMINMPP